MHVYAIATIAVVTIIAAIVLAVGYRVLVVDPKSCMKALRLMILADAPGRAIRICDAAPAAVFARAARALLLEADRSVEDIAEAHDRARARFGLGRAGAEAKLQAVVNVSVIVAALTVSSVLYQVEASARAGAVGWWSAAFVVAALWVFVSGLRFSVHLGECNAALGELSDLLVRRARAREGRPGVGGEGR